MISCYQSQLEPILKLFDRRETKLTFYFQLSILSIPEFGRNADINHANSLIRRLGIGFLISSGPWFMDICYANTSWKARTK